MKLLHTADWHLGKSIYGRSLLEDQAHFIYHSYLPALDTFRPDGVLLCGDVFDRAVARPEALRLFDQAATETCQTRGIPLFVIAGNHDGPDRMAVGGALLRKSGLYLSVRIEGGVEQAVLEAGGEKAVMTLLPYFDPAAARESTGDSNLRGFADSFEAVLAPIRERLDSSCYNVLLSHCFVAGGKASDSEAALYVGGSGEEGADSFKGFDYVALGHLHAPQKSGGRGRYAGSPLKYSFDEERQNKSMTMVTLGPAGIEAEPIPIQPLRDLRTMTGTMEALLKLPASQDYLFANLEGPPVFEPMEKLRPRFPNLLGLRYVDREAAGEPRRDALRGELRQGRVDDMTVAAEFFKQLCGEEMTDDDRSVFAAFLGGDAI